MKQKSNQTVSTRQQASQWFSNKSFLEQYELSDKYFESRNPSLLTIGQVEEMWLKEMQHQSEERTIEQHSDKRVNTKQFKEFNPDLFGAYISKFSDEDKVKAFEILFENSKNLSNLNHTSAFYRSICRAYNAGKQSILNQKSAQDKGDNPNNFFVSSDEYFKSEFRSY